MTPQSPLRIGLFGVGLTAYWEQFKGLEERLKGYVDLVEQRLRAPERKIISFGLIDDPERAFAVAHEVRAQDVDLLIIYVTTYALSSTILPIVRRAKVPVLVLNLQPHLSLDYAAFNALPSRTAMTQEWLAFCAACPMPEIANVFLRCGIPFRQVNGALEDDPACWLEIDEWMAAARAAHMLSHTRLGLMGHYYGGMLDVATNLLAISHIFGVHIEQMEVDELSLLRAGIEDAAVARQTALLHDVFDIGPDCDTWELQEAARTALALEELVQRNGLGALAYYYKGSGVAANEETMSSIILGASLLTARGIPIAGEYEIKNVIAMKIMDALGAGGSFTEYYAVDYIDDIVLMGHDGPGHNGIAEGRTKVRPLDVYHGKVGKGLSVEMSVRIGPITLLSVFESLSGDSKKGGFKLLVAEGTTQDGPTLAIGNTNSRYRFPIGARRFLSAWNANAPAHHCAVGTGHLATVIAKLASLLEIEFVQVC